jgi:hypothetical protein
MVSSVLRVLSIVNGSYIYKHNIFDLMFFFLINYIYYFQLKGWWSCVSVSMDIGWIIFDW